MIDGEGLLQKAREALACEARDGFLLVVATHQHDREIGPYGAHLTKRGLTVHVGHRQVEQHGGERVAALAYDVEPLPLSHPLRRLPNVVLTPHLGYVTDDTYEVFFREAAEDIKAFVKGDPIRVLN